MPQSMTEGLPAWIMRVEYIHDLVREASIQPLKPLHRLRDLVVRADHGLTRLVREAHAVLEAIPKAPGAPAGPTPQASVEGLHAGCNIAFIGDVGTRRKEYVATLCLPS